MKLLITQLKPFGVLIEPKKVNMKVDDIDLTILRDLFDEKQLLVLRGFKTFDQDEEFPIYCERWGEVCVWPFGKVLELVEQDQPEDHIFGNSYVPLHWDGMYRPQVPEFQIFHCMKAPNISDGGRTVFTNTINVLERSSDEVKELWANVIGVYERKMEFYNSRTISPLIVKHPYKDYSVIRYNEPYHKEKGQLINPPQVRFQGECDDCLSTLEKALYDPQHLYAHKWHSGDIVIADNFSLLHGREKFTSKSPRHIRRVQVMSHYEFINPSLEFYE